MSKRYNKMQGNNMMYNRPSGGYQKNLYRQQINAEGIKQPKTVTQKTIKIVAIGSAIVWGALTAFLTYKFKWKGLLIGLAIGLVLVGAGYIWLQFKERQLVAYYKKIGMTEEMYIKELKKRNVDKKQIDQVRKTWSKVKAEPVINNQKSGSKSSASKGSSSKSGSSKGGKKK